MSRALTAVARIVACIVLVSTATLVRAGAGACAAHVEPLSIGTYDPTRSAPADVTGFVHVSCAQGSAPASLTLQLQLSAADRHMNGGRGLHYLLFRNASRTLPWNSDPWVVPARSAVASHNGAPARFEMDVPFYVRILPHQWLQAGANMDALSVSIGY